MNEFMSMNDKMQDMREDMEDVQEMMMDGMAGDTTSDEDELDRELAQIRVDGLPSASSVPSAVPSSAVPASSVPAMPAMSAMPAMPSAYGSSGNDELNNL